MSTWRLHHVGLEVADLDRSLAFYRDLLGLTVTDGGEGGGSDTDELLGVEGLRFRFAELDLGAGQLLELIQPLGPAAVPFTLPAGRPSPSPAGADRPPARAHIGILVDDIAAAYRRLGEVGLQTRSAPVELQEGGAWQGVRALYTADPDGHTVELVQLP